MRRTNTSCAPSRSRRGCALRSARSFSAAAAETHWRAGGILLQFVPRAPERARVPDLDPGDAPEGITPHVVTEDDAWVEGRSLIETVEDVELLDPAVSAERLLYRLFHERGVRVFRDAPVRAQCSCSRDGVEEMLRRFSQDDRDHMVENGVISVTCEFCNATYVFEPADVADQTAGTDGGDGVQPQLIVRFCSGPSSENVGISMSNGSPLSETIP